MKSTKERAELMLWFDESKDHKVECRSRDGAEWFVTNLPNWDWPNCDYRKYEPPREPREVWVNLYQKGQMNYAYLEQSQARERKGALVSEIAVRFREVMPDEEDKVQALAGQLATKNSEYAALAGQLAAVIIERDATRRKVTKLRQSLSAQTEQTQITSEQVRERVLETIDRYGGLPDGLGLGHPIEQIVGTVLAYRDATIDKYRVALRQYADMRQCQNCGKTACVCGRPWRPEPHPLSKIAQEALGDD